MFDPPPLQIRRLRCAFVAVVEPCREERPPWVPWGQPGVSCRGPGGHPRGWVPSQGRPGYLGVNHRNPSGASEGCIGPELHNHYGSRCPSLKYSLGPLWPTSKPLSQQGYSLDTIYDHPSVDHTHIPQRPYLLDRTIPFSTVLGGKGASYYSSTSGTVVPSVSSLASLYSSLYPLRGEVNLEW